jgi:hypothetical protein
MTAYANMLKWFGAAICRMKKRHTWGRAYSVMVVGEHAGAHRQKVCVRCGGVRVVKRRMKK